MDKFSSRSFSTPNAAQDASMNTAYALAYAAKKKPDDEVMRRFSPLARAAFQTALVWDMPLPKENERRLIVNQVLQCVRNYRVSIVPDVSPMSVIALPLEVYEPRALLAWVRHVTNQSDLEWDKFDTSTVHMMFENSYRSALGIRESWQLEKLDTKDWRGRITQIYRTGAHLTHARYAVEGSSNALPVIVSAFVKEALVGWGYTVTPQI